MIVKRSRFIPLGVASILLLAPGCIMSRSGRLPPVAPWPPAGGVTKQSVSLVVRTKASVNGRDVEPTGPIVSMWQEQTFRAYRDAGLFSSVRAEQSPSDIMVEVNLQERGESSLALAFITGLTLYLIPSSATSDITARTEMRDRDGAILGTFEKSETLTFWQQLFLVFVMPFKFPATVSKATIYDLSRATLSEAQGRGVFEPRPAPHVSDRDTPLAPPATSATAAR